MFKTTPPAWFGWSWLQTNITVPIENCLRDMRQRRTSGQNAPFATASAVAHGDDSICDAKGVFPRGLGPKCDKSCWIIFLGGHFCWFKTVSCRCAVFGMSTSEWPWKTTKRVRICAKIFGDKWIVSAAWPQCVVPPSLWRGHISTPTVTISNQALG